MMKFHLGSCGTCGINTCSKKTGLFLAIVGAISTYLIYKIAYQGDEFDRRDFSDVSPDSSNIGGQWLNFSGSLFRLYVYSAFYDDRPSLMSLPIIRIMAISDKTEDLKKNNISRLYCVLYRDDSSYIVVPMTDDPVATSFGHTLNGISAKEYMYKCPTFDGIIPKFVRIIFTPSLNDAAASVNASAKLKVGFPQKPEKRQDFCLCVQSAFGTVDPYRLIEWMELHNILGISLIGIYIYSASETNRKIFQHYSRQGLVDLRYTNKIFANGSKEYKLHHTPVINDCIYRHMYECNRIVVLDFDEVIMPANQNNLLELIRYLDATSPNKPVNFAFRNDYFFFNLPPDENISTRLAVLRFRKKVTVSPEGYAVKSIINPQACTHMHNHYCWGLTANFSKYPNTKSVDPDVALNRHYKMCHFSPKECETVLKNVTQDDVMLKLKDVLTERVREKVKLLMQVDI